MSVFERVFAILIGEEGGFSTNPADPGNWTGGARGRGACKGSKFGIAASAHPGLDIASLTLADAHGIYRQSYWAPVMGDQLPPPLALVVFDAAVNCGPKRAIDWLQATTRTERTGTLAPATLAAICEAAATAPFAFCAAFNAERLAWMAALPTWRIFATGWSRRLCDLPYKSFQMLDPQ